MTAAVDSAHLPVVRRDQPVSEATPLAELAAVANAEHQAATEAAQTALHHVIRSGEALLAARSKVKEGEWGRWLTENFWGSRATAAYYIRIARYQMHLGEATTFEQAKRSIADLPPTFASRGRQFAYDARTREEAAALREDGMTTPEIAQVLDVPAGTVKYWLDPNARHRSAASARKRRSAKNREQIKRAVRKAGAATQEAYAMAERFQDVLGQASDELSDATAQQEIAKAGEHYRKMRDAIVRALMASLAEEPTGGEE